MLKQLYFIQGKRRNAIILFYGLKCRLYESKKQRVCPLCKSRKTKKNGHARGVQTYLCKQCKYRFSSPRRFGEKTIKKFWMVYVFRKQTVTELAQDNNMDKRSIKDILDSYVAPRKIHKPRPVHLVVDATWFGSRKENTSWCAVVARDPYLEEDLAWVFADSETTYTYNLLRDELEELGYTILSVTGDGFSGIKSAFYGIPYQMCHVHMERLVTRGTTKNPQTKAGQVLLALTKSLHYTDKKTFNRRLLDYKNKYSIFLNEKTTHPFTGGWSWTHEGTRMAFLSLLRLSAYLFTFEQDKNIQKTTNSIEGHFGHINQKVGSHNGLSRSQKEKVLHSIFLASTTAPNVDKLDEIL
ncbi:hypothetical protein L6260_00220 [Candidatus Parcubacteria bacterium]|nr:hypothetical protein [Candidatus Parcubacteria bacterium]